MRLSSFGNSPFQPSHKSHHKTQGRSIEPWYRYTPRYRSTSSFDKFTHTHSLITFWLEGDAFSRKSKKRAVVTGYPSAFQALSPPSSTNTFAIPRRRRASATRALVNDRGEELYKTTSTSLDINLISYPQTCWSDANCTWNAFNCRPCFFKI